MKCARIYEEKASGAKAERPELMKLLDNARKGDVIMSGSSIAWRAPSGNSLIPRFC